MAYGHDFSAGYSYAKRIYKEAKTSFEQKKVLSRIFSEYNSTPKHFPFNKGMKSFYEEQTTGIKK